MLYFRFVNKKGHIRVKSTFEYVDEMLFVHYQDESGAIVKLDDSVFKDEQAVKVKLKEEGNRILLEFLDRKGQSDCLFSFEK